MKITSSSRLLVLAICPLFAVALRVSDAQAQGAAPLAPAALPAPATLPPGSPVEQATALVDEALRIAFSDRQARVVTVKTAAALLPRLSEGSRESLTARWAQLANSGDVSRADRLDAYAAFFDVAAKTDANFARSWALQTPDSAARVGGLLQVSRARPDKDYGLALEELRFAQRAIELEGDDLARARSLVFIAYRATELAPDLAPDAIRDASVAVSRLSGANERDNLYAELVSAAARYDMKLARDMAGRISDEGLKNLANARINIAEISQTTITSKSNERVEALATAAAPYDSRALPFLLDLPATESTMKAISATLPRIYVTARPAIEVAQLERLWEYTQKAPQNVYRDELQSRLARLLVLKDLWRGRAWGKQLSWKGGRIQVGAFLKEVLEYRQSQLKAGALQDVANRNVEAAFRQSQSLEGAARAEALLLLAGQILDSAE